MAKFGNKGTAKRQPHDDLTHNAPQSKEPRETVKLIDHKHTQHGEEATQRKSEY
jgi:hypothetical protein